MSESDTLTSARAAVADLERDRVRLAEMRDAANQRLRDARRGTDTELKRASLEAAGLAQAFAEVDDELDAAREHLASLEAEHRRAALERRKAEALRDVEQCERDMLTRFAHAFDVTLAELGRVHALDRQRTEALARARLTAHDLGESLTRPDTVAIARMFRSERHVPRDLERLVDGLFGALEAIRVANYGTRSRDTRSQDAVRRAVTEAETAAAGATA